MHWIFILVSAAAFLQDFPALRLEEQWEQIIISGEQALESATESQAMQIHGQLASSYFYQGDFEGAERHACLCYEKACELGASEEEAHGLYLLSAVARAEEDFASAKAIALEALLLSKGEMKAKVLFNLGAAEMDDPKGNLTRAQKSLEDALHLFTCIDDQQRTAIRLSKVYLMKGLIGRAQVLLIKTMPKIKSQRTLMHAEYLSAQIEKALGNREKALAIAKEALVKAENLSAAKDVERIKDFCEGL